MLFVLHLYEKMHFICLLIYGLKFYFNELKWYQVLLCCILDWHPVLFYW